MTTQDNLFANKDKTITESKQNNIHKIVLIDGHNLAFRSYYAVKGLSTSKGQPTNAIFGFMRSLIAILKEEGENDATVVTFDAPAKTFRHEQFTDYKAAREPTPKELISQISVIKELVGLMGLHQIEVAGLEADDLFGTIAKCCAEQGYNVEIISTDRDAFQLINEQITVYNPVKSVHYNAKKVLEEFGISVEQWIDYRALTGDSSDNIPGAKGIGAKTAAKLIQSYGSLDYILDNLAEIKPVSAAKKIKASLEDVRFSKELSVIVTDADIAIDPKNWANRAMQEEVLIEKLKEFELVTILRDLGLNTTKNPYEEVVWSEDFLEGSLGYVLSSSNPLTASLMELAVAGDNKVAKVPSEKAQEYLKAVGNINSCNAKALAVFARALNLKPQIGDDPLLMAYVIDATVSDAEGLANQYGVGQWGDSAISRATVTAELLKILPPKFSDKQKALYEDMEKPLANVLVDMEATGISLDVNVLQDLSEQLARQITALETRVRDIADNPLLNLNSRDQLAELLFDKLGLQAGKKTTTGKRSTAVGVLEQLKDKHEVVGIILEYRELAKLKSTYLDPLPKLINPKTGRIHTTFSQTTAVTGRLASINPNLQNIPIRTEIGRQIRRGFVAKEGYELLVADYSQIELRILAHISEEAALIEAFKQGEDIHTRTAAQLYGLDINSVSPDMRRLAKTINFGVLYGMSAHRLSREFEIPFGEASGFIKNYFSGYSQVKNYIDSTLEAARQQGFVETLLGRRRFIPDINHKNRNLREYAERTAYNMPIQGAAADIMKIAMVKLAPELKAFEAQMLLQVHDELVIEVPKDKIAGATKIVKDVMQDAYELKVPLLADVGVGDNWLEAK